jgi:hypothetical protein
MHLFSRVGVVTGGPVETLEWAVNITARVNQAMDIEVSLWQGQFGNPLGTVAWSALVESRAQLAEETLKLAADQGYLDLVGQGQAFAGAIPFEDSLRTMVHMTAEPAEPPPLGAWAEITTAVPMAGKIAAAMAWGVEISDYHAAVTGSPVMFLADDYGTFGQVGWIAVHADAAAADAAAAAVMADADYAAKVDGAGDLFVPGQSNRSSTVRLA